MMNYRICENGTYRDMTAEEIEAMNQHPTEHPEPEPTPETQIAELKAQLAALETILLGGETNG